MNTGQDDNSPAVDAAHEARCVICGAVLSRAELDQCQVGLRGMSIVAAHNSHFWNGDLRHPDYERNVQTLSTALGRAEAEAFNRPLHFTLSDDGQPIPEPDVLRWAMWFETGDRVVGKSRIGDVEVSTVFLGVDHGVGGKSPVLWETMLFTNDGNDANTLNGQCWRCAGNRADAEAQHERVCGMVQRGEVIG